MKTKKNLLMASAMLAAGACFGPGAGAGIDPATPAYATADGVSGNLSSVGSDTMNNLMQLWMEGFTTLYPNVNPSMEGKGSSTAPPALIEGTSNLGPMSREMKAEEIAKFEAKFGYKPTYIRTCLDALAIYVHKDNPIQSLTLQQADAIFSSSRKSGAPADITTWGQLGLTGEWASKPISLYGRNSASGTYGYFKEHVLAKGDYKATVKEQPGSAAVVTGVASDLGGCGYSGIGYKTSAVRAVPIVGKDGKPYEATDANVYSGAYAISRPLLLYFNRAPGQALAPLVREFLRYVLSKEGQQVVVKGDFIPMLATAIADERKKVD